MPKEELFSEFQPVSAKAWKQKIQVDLKGADYNDTLVWESPEGIKVKPFYHADDAVVVYDSDDAVVAADFSSDKNVVWKAGHSIYAGNAVVANTKALVFLSRGAESLQFTIPSEDIEIIDVLAGIDMEKTPVYFDLQFLSDSYIKSIVDLAGNAVSNIYLNIDIIGNLGRTGNWFIDQKKDHALLEGMLVANTANVLSVDLSLYQNAGANMVQQLGYAVAHANEYLNHLSLKKSLDVFKGLTFKVAIGTNYFFEIAKLRALRLLWKTLAAEYNITVDCQIMATPTKRNKTLYDYNVNMLRTTTECMAAVLGGADTIFNLPYDAIYHKSNEFGERIALNQLLLLKNESYFDKVANAADGSYYIESLTQQLAEKGLQLFKTIEKGGGFLKQLKDHTIQRKIKESAQKEQVKFDSNETVLVGTNTFVNLADKMKADLELYPFVKIKARKTLLEPIIERRLAEAVEQKRLDDE